MVLKPIHCAWLIGARVFFDYICSFCIFQCSIAVHWTNVRRRWPPLQNAEVTANCHSCLRSRKTNKSKFSDAGYTQSYTKIFNLYTYLYKPLDP